MHESHAYPAPFRDALAEGRLAFPRCDACGRYHWYPLPRCPHCLSNALRWTAIVGSASIFTCSTVHHAFEPGWTSEIPYTVALIEFPVAPGVRLVARIVGDDAHLAAIGGRVSPIFYETESGPQLAFSRQGSE